MLTEVDTFLHIRSWFARQGDGRFVRFVTSAFLLRETGPHYVLLHREREQKFPQPCFVVARLVNLQECRIKRDPLFTDKSSTKPCGRSQNGTRTCLPSAPVPMDLYGMGFVFFFSFFAEHLCRALHNDRTAFTAHRGLSELSEDGSVLDLSKVPEKEDIHSTFAHMFIYRVGLFSS